MLWGDAQSHWGESLTEAAIFRALHKQTCINILCAEAKLNKNYQHYKLFKPEAFAGGLGLLHPQGLSLCQQAAWLNRSGLGEPGVWCWGPDVSSAGIQTSSSLDLSTGHPAVVEGRVLCFCSVSPGFLLSERKPSWPRAAPCCKEEQ